jgi:hypothetical protein
MAVVPLMPSNNLAARIESWFPGADLSRYAEQLDVFHTVAEILQSRIQTPTSPQLDIYVRLPALGKWQDVRVTTIPLISCSCYSSPFLMPQTYFIQLLRVDSYHSCAVTMSFSQIPAGGPLKWSQVSRRDLSSQ